MSTSKFLISGFDTIEWAYYLIASNDCKLDFIELAAQKESMVRAKVTKPKPIQIGLEKFLIASHGTSSGYSFVIENDAFMIQYGEFNYLWFSFLYRCINFALDTLLM